MGFSGIKSIDQLLKMADDFNHTDLEISRTMPPQVRKKINTDLSRVSTGWQSKNKYYETIPMNEIITILGNYGYSLGSAAGLESLSAEEAAPALTRTNEGSEQLRFNLMVKRYVPDKDGYLTTIEPVKNSMLIVSVYKMPSGLYEVLAYAS